MGSADVTRFLAETQTVHDTPGMIGVVAHADQSEDGLGEAFGRPLVCIDAGGARTTPVHLGNCGTLFRREPTRAARSASLAKRFHTSSRQRPVPAGGGGA